MHDPLAAAQLHRLLLQLQPDARAVMLLRYQEDLDPTDIVAVLDMPLATVKSHLRRSLEWLRAQYPGDDHEP
jgi:RNA polymerase sigma-70 factor (ECF subfamily)